jgi:APA family basic amino acid/polyamine antiporter
VGSFFHAAALLFVAYTGYGRIATMGEEVREPRRTIPRAIVATLWTSAALYAAVAIVAVAAVGAGALGSMAVSRGAPLETAARSFPVPGVRWLVAAGAMTAMLGVLLNLILGLSRVLLAMGRRGDMPAPLGRLNVSGTAPTAAVLAVGGVVTALTLLGNVRVTWSFSAFTVLIYYALTNLAALALPAPERLYGRWLAWAGLFSCLFLAFWVEWWIWCAGLALIAVGLAWHRIAATRVKSATSRAGREASPPPRDPPGPSRGARKDS